MKKVFLISLIFVSMLAACNKDWKFPDYNYSTVYFPYQSPVRTLVLGEDIYDNTLDNQHKFLIMAAMGGVYENTKNISLSLAVDNSLTQKLKFNSATGADAIAMPSSYYILPKNLTITIPAGQVMGGIEVQLTDAFFADPLAVKNTYIIPLRIVTVTNVDSVLRGRTTRAVADPRQPGDDHQLDSNPRRDRVRHV